MPELTQPAGAVNARRFQHFLWQCLQAGEEHDHDEGRRLPEAVEDDQQGHRGAIHEQAIIEELLHPVPVRTAAIEHITEDQCADDRGHDKRHQCRGDENTANTSDLIKKQGKHQAKEDAKWHGDGGEEQREFQRIPKLGIAQDFLIILKPNPQGLVEIAEGDVMHPQYDRCQQGDGHKRQHNEDAGTDKESKGSSFHKRLSWFYCAVTASIISSAAARTASGRWRKMACPASTGMTFPRVDKRAC